MCLRMNISALASQSVPHFEYGSVTIDVMKRSYLDQNIILHCTRRFPGNRHPEYKLINNAKVNDSVHGHSQVASSGGVITLCVILPMTEHSSAVHDIRVRVGHVHST